MPFTTGPVMVLSGERDFICQDQIDYTSIGAGCSVKLSKAVDIRIVTEVTESTSHQTKKMHSLTYQLVNVFGKITIQNMKKESSQIEITSQIYGDLKETSMNPSVTKQIHNHAIDPTNSVEWNFALDAGAKDVIQWKSCVWKEDQSRRY